MRVARKTRQRLTLGSLALAAHAALAQNAPTQNLERVEITGSSIKRIESETSLPVQVITRDAIEKTGAVTVEQLLNTVTALSSSGQTPAAGVSSATTGGISGISMRGLNSTRTLVLLNGRRIAPYGIGFTNDNVSVDVNSIPLAAVERVEILKDGASAVYGSDAIAGVVNFILRKDFVGGEATAYYGDTSDGGASATRGSLLFGAGDLGKDRFNVMGTFSWQHEKPLYGAQRSFAQSGINSINDTSSGNTFPANFIATNGAFGTRNPSNPSCPPPYAVYDPQLSTTGCRFDPSPLVQLIPDAERTSLFLSGRYALTPTMELFAEGSWNRNRQNNVIQPVPISDQFALPPNHPLFNVAPYNGTSTILVQPGTPFYPTAYVQSQLPAGAPLPVLDVRWRDNINGNRHIEDVADAPRLVVGLRGSAASWDWDAAYLHSESRVRENVVSGFPILSQVLPILNSGNVNFWGPSPDNVVQQVLATDFHGEAFNIKSSLDSVSGKASRELFNLPAGPLAIALGAEERKEKYQFNASSQISTGDVAGYGGNFLPVDKSRNVDALFAEVNIPAYKNFEVNAAVRWDNYQGVGSSTNPKLGLRYQPTKEILLRASGGKGFRAPSLLDLFAPNTTGVTPQGLNDSLRCPTTGSSLDCATQFPTLNGGNANLKPEKSHNYTAGIVFEPTNAISVAVDWFTILLQDQINNGIPAAVILSDFAKYGHLVTRGPVDPAFPNLPGPITQIDQTNINVGKTNLSGWDFDARVRIPAGDYGRVTVQYTGTYFYKYDSENIDGSFSPVIGQANTATGGVVPRLKTYLSATWAIGPWNTTLAQNWQSSYDDLFGTLESGNSPPRKVGVYETYDAQVQYLGVKNLKMTAGMKNIFNRAPPYTNAGGQTSFQAGYDPTYADPRGRFVYGSLTYSFR
ncbi:MAG TPA: TonB-dependent receptor [Caldimonas sp.]|nr:TonB-dependent receptor [Caldimonas sp.]